MATDRPPSERSMGEARDVLAELDEAIARVRIDSSWPLSVEVWRQRVASALDAARDEGREEMIAPHTVSFQRGLKAGRAEEPAEARALSVVLAELRWANEVDQPRRVSVPADDYDRLATALAAYERRYGRER